MTPAELWRRVASLRRVAAEAEQLRDQAPCSDSALHLQIVRRNYAHATDQMSACVIEGGKR